MELLSQNLGQVFDKERIYEHIWGYDSEGDSSVVAEHIRRIRTKIAAYTDHIYVETVGLHFVKIKNQDAAVNSKITSFRFFLNDFPHLSV